jgi:Replication-relaxation
VTRRRWGRRRRGAVRVTARDVAILGDLTRFGALTLAQVTRRHFGAPSTAAHRLDALEDAGYVVHRRPWYRGPGVYAATPDGAQLAAVGLPAARWTLHALAHRLAVADLADALLAGHPGGRWVTERELRRDGLAAVRDRRDGRLLAGAPHAPDGVLVLPDGDGGGGGGGAVAVELELTPKPAAEHARILRWYAAELATRRVVWFAATDTLRRRLEEAIARERLDDFIGVEPLPAGVAVPAWG